MKKVNLNDVVSQLTNDVKNALLLHFDSIYSCETLTDHEYKMVYLAYLWENGYVTKLSDGFLVIDKAVTGVDLNDYELTFEVEETGGSNLNLTYDYYNLAKIIQIIKADF